MTTLSPFSGSPESIKNEIVVASPVVGAAPQVPAKPATKSKPRKRVNTAEKRHQHNAIERQRRETLNGKFISLARLLPSLASHRRPSKSAIVNGSIAHLTHQRDQRLLAAKLLRQLCAERDELFKEVNDWRKANGFPVKEGASAWTDEMEDVCSVEKEVFGTFANMEGDDNDDDDGNDLATDQAMSFNGLVNNGLITPRSSTEIDMTQGMFAIPVNHDKRPAPVGATNWSHEFPFAGSVSSNSSLPFNAFMSDSLDHSSTGSPTNSQGNVLTPPTTGDNNTVFTGAMHTPSPRSTHSVEERGPAPGQQWTPQQMLYFQQQIQQQQLHRSHSTPVFPAQHHAANGGFGGHSFSGGFNHHMNNNSGNGTPDFSQALLEQMFTQQQPSSGGIGADQVEQWRKFSMTAQPSVAELKNAVRQGMGLGLNMANMWSAESQTVEGF